MRFRYRPADDKCGAIIISPLPLARQGQIRLQATEISVGIARQRHSAQGREAQVEKDVEERCERPFDRAFSSDGLSKNQVTECCVSRVEVDGHVASEDRHPRHGTSRVKASEVEFQHLRVNRLSSPLAIRDVYIPEPLNDGIGPEIGGVRNTGQLAQALLQW